MAKKKKATINLLDTGGFTDTVSGRILAWILSSFRVIVIVTEVLVMLAFLSRFWLDAQNSDLEQQIRQTQAVITASQPFEKDFKDTQARLKIFNDYAQDEGRKTEIVNIISSSIPPRHTP